MPSLPRSTSQGTLLDSGSYYIGDTKCRRRKITLRIAYVLREELALASPTVRQREPFGVRQPHSIEAFPTYPTAPHSGY